MPILFVHGVNVRDRSLFQQITPLLRRWVCPEISARPEQVLIDDAYWGDLGVSFAWNGASRPRSRILGMGAGATPTQAFNEQLEIALAFEQPLPTVPAAPAAVPPAVLGSGFGPAGAGAAPRSGRLRQLAPDALADLLCGVLMATSPANSPTVAPDTLAHAALMADDVAHDPGLQAALRGAKDAEAELALIGAALQAAGAAATPQAVTGMGFKERWQDATVRLREVFQRADDLPLYAASVGLLEARKWAHEAISLFAGDVVTYAESRSADDPGPIVRRVMDKLRELDRQRGAGGDEPLVVVTHSMGGQIVYDLVSWFLPAQKDARPPRIDFWCATASQVGFFEEAKLFVASDRSIRAPARVPFPAQALGVWWNVWDPNDVLSFSTQGIFDGVDDGPYDSGSPLTRAHGGYLQRPSFYRRLAEKLRAAAAAGWKAA
ncbi:MAG: hypothetical protein JWQ03_562 [Variovorax sp.]|nr:hypothetical protein [Variovorax sp.]